MPARPSTDRPSLEPGATQLFRLDDDPYEQTSLAEAHPEVVASLRSRYVPRHD